MEKPLAVFEAAVGQAFAFLEEEYGFHRSGSGLHAPEAWVVFENATTGVTVKFELGAGPWVELAKLGPIDGLQARRERYSLDYILMVRAPTLKKVEDCPELKEPQLSLALRQLADYLKTHADDILRGDFQLFPELRSLAEQRLKEG